MENREIKFRAWCSGKHGVIEFIKSEMDYEVFLSPSGFYTDVENGWDIQGVISTIPIMQFSGIKDKNDVEIYESDILKTPTGLAVVVKDFNWGLKSIGSEAVDFEPKEYFEKCQVIGNIYENPKLL